MSAKLAGTVPRPSAEELLAHVGDAVNSTDIHGVIQSWNAAAERLYGYSEQEVLGLPISILFFPEDATVLEEQIMAPLSRQDSHQVTVRNRHKNGSEIFVDLRLSVIRDERGDITGYIGCSHDVTPRRQAEENYRSEIQARERAEAALSRSENQLREILKHGPAVLFRFAILPDDTFRMQYLSENAKSVLGFYQEFFGGREFWISRIHPEDRQPTLAAIAALFDSDASEPLEYRFLHARGEYRVMREYLTRVLSSDGQTSEIVGQTIDVTAEKRILEIQKKQERLHAFTEALLAAQEAERRRISRELHDDLNQRLAAMILDMSMLERNPPSTPNEVRANCIQLKGFISQVSDDIRRISLQLHSAGLEHFGLEAAVEHECSLVESRTNIPVHFRAAGIPRKLPETLALSLYRVLQESLRNAVKHAHARHIRVALKYVRAGIALIVRDDGIGFDPGSDSDKAALGLISMEERVGRLGGEFTVKSRLGQGTWVRASIPYMEEDQN